MHFSAPLAVISALSGAHALVIPRDASVIIGVLTAVQGDIDGLDSAVNGWTSDPSPVLDASNKLVDTISQGTATVQGSPDLTLDESLTLLDPVQSLKQHAQTLVDDLKAKKDTVQQAGLCEVVEIQIGTISDKSKGLIDATVSKVPQDAQGIAQDQAQGILDVLADAQSAFSPGNCVNA
ncbi:Cell wall galactomannoprotein [Cordyceps fumosorosea ARSEF 2679]|uniref:Cell wall galactomannoprotein n=1 Tax=Cordyceps fumosorosea (strain ARSEF 2679) TaxID=1081104 RepID=A0A167QNZ7_CORFA|nr:Cell wall galactomannoprotein [Cordyceps fumosorosea ARSEF 2679]OAA57813.1 Cell wall galactomannoprotein [Cordyceps fumosorosea ARSEF 2679]